MIRVKVLGINYMSCPASTTRPNGLLKSLNGSAANLPQAFAVARAKRLSRQFAESE